MLSTFASLTPQIKVLYKNFSIDNLAFKFHYRGTFVILMISTLLVTSRQYIGDHISCISSSIPVHVVNTFCFFTSTFTVIRHYNYSSVDNRFVAHAGVGPMDGDDDPIKNHAYYQWVPFVLFLQAMSFYMPHLFWRTFEGGKIKLFVNGMKRTILSKYVDQDGSVAINDKFNIKSKKQLENKIGTIKTIFLNYIKINSNWARKMIFCELLNFGNLILQVYITNKFLAGQFYDLGYEFIKEDFKHQMDILDVVFPKMTKCHFHKYGASGSIQKHDALCVISLNVINEKIYVFLWFWYWLLLGVTVLGLLWRITTFVMHSISKRFNVFVFSFACPGHIKKDDVVMITKNLNFSSWLFLYYLAKNMDSYVFKILLNDLAKELRNPKDMEDKNGTLEEKTPLHKHVTFDKVDDVNEKSEKFDKNL